MYQVWHFKLFYNCEWSNRDFDKGGSQTCNKYGTFSCFTSVSSFFSGEKTNRDCDKDGS